MIHYMTVHRLVIGSKRYAVTSPYYLQQSSATVACSISERSLGPSFDTIAPSNLKLLNFSSFCSLTLISLLMRVLVFFIAFCLLGTYLYYVTHVDFVDIFNKSTSSCSSSVNASMSSASRRLEIVLPPTLTVTRHQIREYQMAG